MCFHRKILIFSPLNSGTSSQFLLYKNFRSFFAEPDFSTLKSGSFVSFSSEAIFHEKTIFLFTKKVAKWRRFYCSRAPVWRLLLLAMAGGRKPGALLAKWRAAPHCFDDFWRFRAENLNFYDRSKNVKIKKCQI